MRRSLFRAQPYGERGRRVGADPRFGGANGAEVCLPGLGLRGVDEGGDGRGLRGVFVTVREASRLRRGCTYVAFQQSGGAFGGEELPVAEGGVAEGLLGQGVDGVCLGFVSDGDVCLWAGWGGT